MYPTLSPKVSTTGDPEEVSRYIFRSEDVELSTNDARVSRDSLQNDDIELSDAKVVVSDKLGS